MNILELATPVKGTSFTELLASIDQISGRDWKEDPSKDKGVPFPFENRKYIRTLISSTIKYRFPGRSYGAYEETVIDPASGKEVEVLMVRRFA